MNYEALAFPSELKLPSGHHHLSIGSVCERPGDIREWAANDSAAAEAQQKARTILSTKGPIFK